MTQFRVPDPYAALPDLPALEVTSESFTEGATLSAAQLGGKMGVEGGQVTARTATSSPSMRWATRSSWATTPRVRSSVSTCSVRDWPVAP